MIRTDKPHLISKAITHPGMTGKNNEDRYAVTAFTLEDTTHTPVLLAVLSDGIGGHRSGEVASEMVTNLVTQKIAESDGSNPPAALEQAIHFASQEVNALSQSDSGHKGMGATVSIAFIIGNRLFTATVGDSRIYMIRGNDIFQVSTDHTWIQEALESGILTPEQAVGHPNAHIIRRYVGSATPPEVDFRIRLGDQLSNQQMIARQGMELLPGDRLLLCSDGLTDLVNEKEIFMEVMKNPPEATLKNLVDMANQRGGHDNITIILVQVPGTSAAPAAARKKLAASSHKYIIGCLGLLVLGAVIAVVAFGYFNSQFFTNLLHRQSATPQVVETTQEVIKTPEVTASATNTFTTIPSATLTITATLTELPKVTDTVEMETTTESNLPPPPAPGAITAQPTISLTPTITSTPTTTTSITP